MINSWGRALSVVLAVVALTEALRFLRIAQYPFRHPVSLFPADFIEAALLLVVGAGVTAWAAWAIWEEKPSARAWASAGSLVLVIAFLRQYAHNAFFPHGSYALLSLPSAILGPAIAILWPNSSRTRTIPNGLFHRTSDPPTMFGRDNKDS